MPAPETSRVRWSRALLYPAILLLIIAGFYWKLVFTYQFDWLWGPDLAQQVLPWFEEEARQMQHSRFPLWDPHTWAGQPLVGQAQPGAAYPLNWLLFLAPRKNGHIQFVYLQWYYVLIHYMAALFCFMLCRDLGRSRPAALIGGIVFSLTAYVGSIDWPQMINGAVWAPLVFLFLLRAVHGRRPLASAALSGMFLGISWLSGHHQVPIFLSLAALGTWLFYILRNGRPAWGIARLAVVFAVFMLLAGALQILPAEEYGHLAKRWAGARDALSWNQPVPYIVHRTYSLYPMSLFGITFPGLYRNADPFLGVVALTLALLGLALSWKHRTVKLFAALGLAGLVYALGQNSVFQGFLYAVVPLVDKARVPANAVILFGFGAAALAAFGADFFFDAAASPWRRRAEISLLVFGVISYVLIFAVLLEKKGSWEMDDRVALTPLIALLLAALLHAWRGANVTRPQALTLLLLLLLLELGNNAGFRLGYREEPGFRADLEKVASNADLAKFLDQQTGERPFRIESEAEEISENWAGYYNFDAIKTRTASLTTNMSEVEFFAWQSRLLFGVKYTISRKPVIQDGVGVFSGESGIKIYQNPSAFPRAWTVHELVPIRSAADGRAFINDHLSELHSKALTWEKQPPQLATCAGGERVAFAAYTPSRITMKASLGCAGMLVLPDTYFPGWLATVDGRSAPIYEVNLCMRGVRVPQGSHTVEFRYRPRSVLLGALLSLTGVLGACALAFRARRQA
jgi:membrane protein YfhO